GFGQFAQFGQCVRLLLFCCQVVREVGEDATCQGDVTCLDIHTSRSGECLDDRQQRIGGESRSFVGDGVDYGRGFGHVESLIFLQQLRDQLSLLGGRSEGAHYSRTWGAAPTRASAL